MAYVSNPQELVPVNTQVVLSSSLQLPQKKYGEENTRPSYSVTLQDSMDLDYPWTVGFASRFGLSGSEDVRSEIDLNPDSFNTLKYRSYTVFVSYETRPDIALSLQSLFDGGANTSISNTSLSKSWQFFPNLILNLQDPFIVKQIRDERNTLVHGLPRTQNPHWLVNDLTIASSSEDVQPLEQLYRFREPIKIHHFLENNLFLIPLLKEAYTNIRKYFPYVQLFLKLVVDPEAIDDEQLVVFIAVEKDIDEASQALDRLDEEWWLSAMKRAQDKLCITLEFR
ncbi:MAG: hypothetical protein M3Y39_18560 [Chloroflexota bacterium]|nr:hypothetical protein [Chloroflexota bacterium]